MQTGAIGIAWYRPEDYDRLRAMFTDGSNLQDTFDEWLESAQHLQETVTSQGFVVVRVPIDPDTFPEWCRTKGIEMDSKARSEYAAEYCRTMAGRSRLSSNRPKRRHK